PALIDLDNRGKKDLELLVSVTWAAPYAYQPVSNPSLDGVSGRAGPVHQVPVALPARSRKRISACLLTPDGAACSVWAFAQDAQSGRTLARGELTVRLADPQKRIVGIVGLSRPEGLQDDATILATLQADELPEDWKGYGSLEALVWLDGRATELRSAAQVDALLRWISSGGRLYVARANTLNLAGTPLADLLPVTLGAGRELESLGGSPFPPGPALVLENTQRRGLIRAESHGVALVTESPRDAGRVTFIALDPSRDPFAGSPQAKGFWKWLLKPGPLPPPPRVEEEHPPSAIGSSAISRYAGRFPDISAPEIGGLFLLIILYLVVVGPFDYLLLRWLRKLEFTWFTFPAYVTLFTLFILLAGGAFIQRAAHQREIIVEDHFPDTGFTRRRVLSAVLSSTDAIYKVEDAEPLSSNHIVKQQGFDAGGKITDVEILPGPPPLVGNWLLNRNYTGLAYADRCDSSPAVLHYTISSQDNVEVRLTIRNTSSQTFEGSTLVTSRGVYWISSIPPGESPVSGSRTAATLEEYVEQDGLRPTRRPPPAPLPGEDAERIGITEQELNPSVRKALVGAAFAPPGTELETRTGFAKGLLAQRWLESGGSILCTWPRGTGPLVRFDPKPGRYTAVALHRFFQGPPP
ncbi:MAG TPA: hypothetical protein VMU54_14675, partial [Planctomycetota bacterium]|nr:hypothetical protein [Planctomycetota bacterium]